MNLGRFLEEQNISQAQFARDVGVSAAMVWQWVNGYRPIAPIKALAIERATKGRIKRHDLRPDVYPKGNGAGGS